MKKIPVFYCGKVNSQGGSKQSLLNILYLLNNTNFKFKIIVGNEGWFTNQLINNNISYSLIEEPAGIQEINMQVNKLKIIFNSLLSIPKIIINWFKVFKENKKIKKKIILNETRDLILFLPYLFSNNEIILWLRSEELGIIQSLLLNRVNKAVSVSSKTKKNVHSCKKDKIEVIYNFLEKPLNSQVRNNERKRITIAGSIQPIKGQQDAIESLLLLPETFTLNIVGRIVDYNYYNQLLKTIKKYNLEERVFFVGSKNKFLEYLNNNTDFILMPSKTESFGRVAMEGMSLGIPVIAYRVGGLPEVIADGNTAILLDYGDVKGLASAIQRLSENREDYFNMSKKSLEVFQKKFSSEAILEKLKSVLY